MGEQGLDVRWTSSSAGLLLRNRLSVRLSKCAGPDMLRLNMAKGLLRGGEDEVDEAEDDEGDEQSSDEERLRLRAIVG